MDCYKKGLKFFSFKEEDVFRTMFLSFVGATIMFFK